MNPMIEQVAKAIAIQLSYPEKPSLRAEHTHAAIAAIAALREPTQEMLAVTEMCEYEGQSNALRNWQAMIDEILK